jgi:methylmalonyl-CoA mutase, C-terminal domain
VRLLLCKPGLDGHDRGVKLLARACRDAGMEVVYGGVRQSVDEIVMAAVQEDVDVIGVSNHSGLLVELCEQLLQRLADEGAGDKPIVAGGTLVGAEAEKLSEMGVRAVFGPGSSIDEIVEHIREVAEEAHNVEGR